MNDVIFVMIVALALVAGYNIGASTYDIRDKAIEYGCAQYNSQTAKFEWIEK